MLNLDNNAYVKYMRQKLGMDHRMFAFLIGTNIRTLKLWEQYRSVPDYVIQLLKEVQQEKGIPDE